ncbi:TPA: hypothetical protein NJ528_002491 [Vibrio parahaemolyticus]|uniref:hypothetical protein n=1 Tax=Vibrio parahaemolyticus TaxID=670 RepID=UPI0023613E0B|nr:hypothetical protein [Vibrio parahaemolyticus]HCG8288414.1 hypothetical protein [Vibrio parahaemolyticus]HCG8293604.1 hypothetical protein [Vibrio parahaemolyticus]HCG8298984.1 hypothetical protein [Vibrio parahaemolyticus]HCG8308968.1 hypothetical protein [Vibrio parahaemolyticus]HCH0864966.1 hypothetical protein [Vibrio parahaemolyticus]
MARQKNRWAIWTKKDKVRQVRDWVINLLGIMVFIDKEPKYTGIKGCAIVILSATLAFTIYQIPLTRQAIDESRYSTNVSIISNANTPNSLFVHSLNELHFENSFDSLEVRRKFSYLKYAPYLDFIGEESKLLRLISNDEKREFLSYRLIDSNLKLKVVNSKLSFFYAENSHLDIASRNSEITFLIENSIVNHACVSESFKKYDYEYNDEFSNTFKLRPRDYLFEQASTGSIDRLLDIPIYALDDYLMRNRPITYIFQGQGSDVQVSDCQNRIIQAVAGHEMPTEEQVITPVNSARLLHINNAFINLEGGHIYLHDVDNSDIYLNVYFNYTSPDEELFNTAVIKMSEVRNSKIVLSNLAFVKLISLNNIENIVFYVGWSEDCDEIKKASLLGIDSYIANPAVCVEGKLKAENPYEALERDEGKRGMKLT